MKKLILILIGILMFILTINLALASFGGSSELIKHFDNCNNLTVKVTGTEIINDGEYFLQNCRETPQNLWNCDCDENNTFNLYLETKINVVNEYNFTIDYMFTKEVEESEKQIIEQIEIKNPDIVIDDIKYSNNILELELTSEGNKTVEIGLGTLNCPEGVTIDDEAVSFICENNIVNFNASFSTKIIKLIYPTSVSVSGGSDTGGKVEYIRCRTENMRYWLRNGICTYTCGDDENARMEMAKWESVPYDCFTNKTITGKTCINYIFDGNECKQTFTCYLKDKKLYSTLEECEKILQPEEKPTEPVITQEEKSDLWKNVFIVIVILLLILFMVWFTKITKGGENIEE